MLCSCYFKTGLISPVMSVGHVSSNCYFLIHLQSIFTNEWLNMSHLAELQTSEGGGSTRKQCIFGPYFGQQSELYSWGSLRGFFGHVDTLSKPTAMLSSSPLFFVKTTFKHTEDVQTHFGFYCLLLLKCL